MIITIIFTIKISKKHSRLNDYNKMITPEHRALVQTFCFVSTQCAKDYGPGKMTCNCILNCTCKCTLMGKCAHMCMPVIMPAQA